MTSLDGDALPPCYIFDTRTTNEENFGSQNIGQSEFPVLKDGNIKKVVRVVKITGNTLNLSRGSNSETTEENILNSMQKSDDEYNDEPVCLVCQNWFKSEAKRKSHECKGAIISKDLLLFSLKHAKGLIDMGKIDYIETDTSLRKLYCHIQQE